MLATGTQYVLVPLTGPYTDLTVFPAGMAIVPAGAPEPDTPAYKTAAWLAGEIAYQPAAGELPAGDYDVYARIVAGSEDVRLLAGRLRVGGR